ncbi:MAG TPA: DUF6394 family protein [Micropruina sp.]|nr:DUF6394 family protein [Micropruina sp.]
MNSEKVIFGFFITLAAALNFGFWLGEMDRVELHNVWFLAAAIVVSLIATVLKFGDRTQLGAVHLATSLVADVQLIAAAVVAAHVQTTAAGLTSVDMALIVSLSGGALLANVISVVLMISELITARR